MTKLMPVSWKQLVKRLKDFGFECPFSGGRHPYMIKGRRFRIAKTMMITTMFNDVFRIVHRDENNHVLVNFIWVI